MSPVQEAIVSDSKSMGLFARYLTVWVFLCIVAGIGLGYLFPSLFQALGGMEVAHINLPVAVLIWAMILPMLLKIDYSSLSEVWDHRRGVGVTVGNRSSGAGVAVGRRMTAGVGALTVGVNVGDGSRYEAMGTVGVRTAVAVGTVVGTAVGEAAT